MPGYPCCARTQGSLKKTQIDPGGKVCWGRSLVGSLYISAGADHRLGSFSPTPSCAASGSTERAGVGRC